MNKPDTLNDSLDDLLSGPMAEQPREAIHAPAGYKPATFDEKCRKCGGSGSWRGIGQCFACKGKGKLTFKTSPETRGKKRSQASVNRAKKEAEADAAIKDAVAAFQETFPIAYGWLVAKAPTFPFAASLLNSLNKWGNLTDGHHAAIAKIQAKDAERAKENAARAATAPQADTAGIDRLKLAFDTAIANAKAKGRGLKMPRITIGGIIITPAKATSTNPGALYVKRGGEYLGKVQHAKFFASRECDADTEKRVLAFIADPKAAAIAYGIETGVCCICNATLTNKKSIEAGIGPICATKFGW